MTQPTVTEADIRAEARRICEEEGVDPPYGVMGELVLAGVRAGIALARRIAAEREAVVVAFEQMHDDLDAPILDYDALTPEHKAEGWTEVPLIYAHPPKEPTDA